MGDQVKERTWSGMGGQIIYFRGMCSQVDFYALQEKEEEGNFRDIHVTQKHQNPRSKEGRRQGLRSQLMSFDPVGSEVGARAVPLREACQSWKEHWGIIWHKRRPRGGSRTRHSHPLAL